MPLKQSNLNENVVFVICAHSDDQIFGPGGTVAKYAKEGKQVFTIIFSYGEVSHPWFQKHITIKARVKESLAADKFMGGSGVLFLGLDEGKFIQQYASKHMHAKLKRLILKYRPKRIFTHAVDDPMPDHRALTKCLVTTLDKIKYSGEVYMFDVWTLFNFKKRHYVSIAIDISDTFKKKIQALKMFKSQGAARFSLTWSVYLKAWLYGKRHNIRFAEVFYKLR
ncbi:MAG: PIG-L deacetylase family protein [Candidatus Woesearchaeota archaeon]